MRGREFKFRAPPPNCLGFFARHPPHSKGFFCADCGDHAEAAVRLSQHLPVLPRDGGGGLVCAARTFGWQLCSRPSSGLIREGRRRAPFLNTSTKIYTCSPKQNKRQLTDSWLTVFERERGMTHPCWMSLLLPPRTCTKDLGVVSNASAHLRNPPDQ